MTNTCPACGTEPASETARHCHECGAPLDGSTTDAGVGSGTGPPPPPPQQPPPPYRPTQHPSGLSSETRNWAMAAHLSAFLGAWVALAFVGPLVVWAIKREDHPFVAEHAREALNFNLTLLIYLVVAGILAFVLIGIPLLVAIGITWLVLTIIAAVRAANGESYRYPLTIRFVS